MQSNTPSDSTPPVHPDRENGGQDDGLNENRSHHLGLYVLPALFVLAAVLSWLCLFWLLHDRHDPLSLVAGMQQPGHKSWQKAYAVSQLLLDPKYDALKDDSELCIALARVLEQQNQQAAIQRQDGVKQDDELIHFRAFLCRALGEFRVRDGLPMLLSCAAVRADAASPEEPNVEVRRSALEGIAVLASNLPSGELSTDDQVVDVVVAASRADSSPSMNDESSGIASTAAYALGVIGGERARKRLTEMVTDSRADVRFNAATGLARHGDQASVPVLLEMLTSYQQELDDSLPASRRVMVVTSGIAAATQLLPNLASRERDRIRVALQSLNESTQIPARVRLDAKTALLTLPPIE